MYGVNYKAVCLRTASFVRPEGRLWPASRDDMKNQHSQVFTRTRCASAVAAVMSILAAPPVLAQEAPANPSAQPVNVVVVAGTRASVASSIDRKKGASTVTDSIVAEDIGEFPDKNVGEALSRITGVQLSRDFGEGSQVSIRGVAPDLNRIEINGMSVLGAGGGSGRGAELRELASELIKSIDVYKGVTADMTEGGVGGTVSVTTRKPLDFNKRTIATTVSAEHSTSRGGVQPRASLLLADRFFDNKFGIMANLVFDDVHTQNDYARNTSWRFLRDWDFSPEKTVVSRDPALAGIGDKAGCSSLTGAQRTACLNQWNDYSPGIARYGVWTRDDKRSSAEVTAQYQFTKGLSAYISRQQNIQDRMLNDRNFGTDFNSDNRLAGAGNPPVYNMATGVPTQGGTCIPISATSTPAGMTVTNHHVTGYTVGNCLNLANFGGNSAFSTSARDFSLKIESVYNQAGFNFREGALDAKGFIAKTKSTWTSHSNNIVLTQNAPGLRVALDEQSIPRFDFPAGYSPEDSGAYTQMQLQYRPGATQNTEDQAKLDFTYRLNMPVATRLLFGVQAARTSSRGYNGGGYLASAGANLISTADDVIVPTANVNQTITYDPLYTGTAQRPRPTESFLNQAFSTTFVNAARMREIVDTVRGRSAGTFFKGFDEGAGLPSSFVSPLYDKGAQFVDTSAFNHGNLYQATANDGQVYPQIPSFLAEQRIRSAYLRLDFEHEVFGKTIDGNIGVRYTGTRDSSTGLARYSVRQSTSADNSTLVDRVKVNTIATVDNEYHDVLPSFNAATWLIDDTLVARIGWAKVMARPNVGDTVPNATCVEGSGNRDFGGDGTDDCTAGNPALEPFRATNKDFSVEWYPNNDSQLSMALFRKDITTFVLPRQIRRGVDLFRDGRLWDVNQPLNGRGATTKGIELTGRTALTFLPGWLGGFGVDANYTLMDYKYAPGKEQINSLDGTVLPYPGMSKNSYNVGIWYDRDKFNARLAYNSRSRYYTGGTDVSGNPRFSEKTGYLDGKFQYRFSENITFAIEGKNLTDQEERSTSGDPFRLNELAWAGRRYFVSVSFKN